MDTYLRDAGLLEGETCATTERTASVLMAALSALVATKWEVAASLAAWALATLPAMHGADAHHMAWSAHTIMGR